MGTALITFIIMVVVATGVMYLVIRWAVNYVQRFIENKIKAFEQIVNQEKVPVEWSQPFVKRIEKLEQAGKNQSRIAQIKQRAKAKCMRNLEELINYADKANLAADYDAKRIMLQELNKMQQIWQGQTWDEMLTTERVIPDDETNHQSQNME